MGIGGVGNQLKELTDEYGWYRVLSVKRGIWEFSELAR